MNKAISDRYERIRETECAYCEKNKPGKKSDCLVKKRLILGQDPVFVAQDSKFFIGDKCKNFKMK